MRDYYEHGIKECDDYDNYFLAEEEQSAGLLVILEQLENCKNLCEKLLDRLDKLT